MYTSAKLRSFFILTSLDRFIFCRGDIFEFLSNEKYESRFYNRDNWDTTRSLSNRYRSMSSYSCDDRLRDRIWYSHCLISCTLRYTLTGPGNAHCITWIARVLVTLTYAQSSCSSWESFDGARYRFYLHSISRPSFITIPWILNHRQTGSGRQTRGGKTTFANMPARPSSFRFHATDRSLFFRDSDSRRDLRNDKT